MIVSLVFYGIITGLLASMPVGPVSILIIQRTINIDRLNGFYSGMGAALSDTIYACLAGFSVSLFIQFINAYEFLFKISGSVILLLLGLLILFSHPEKYAPKNGKNKNSYFKKFVTTFMLTITNPLIIFMHLGLFAGFGIANKMNDPLNAMLVLAGFPVGAILWWLFLTWIVSILRQKFNLKLCLWLNRIAGAAIVIIVLISFSFFIFT